MSNYPKFMVLGTRVDLISKDQLSSAIDSFLETKGHYVVTPNPEVVLLAQKDKEFQEIIEKADISLADGIGIIMAGWLYGKKIPRHTGSGLVPVILEKAEKEERKVMVINLSGGLSTAQELEKKILRLYPKLKIEVIDVKKDPALSAEAQEAVQNFSPEIIFVTLGMVVQEKLIATNLNNWPSVRLAMSVGGSFELLTGKIKRPPIWMHKLGLEWVWRVMMNPKRIKRSFVAIPKFVIRVLAARISGK